MKKHLQTIIIIIIFGIISHVIICNIEQITYLNNKRYEYNFKDSREIKSIKLSLSNIEENILEIDNSYLTDDEIDTIKDDLNAVVKVTKSLDFWKYKKSNGSMNQVELSELILDTNKVDVLPSIDIYRILSRYDSSLDLVKFVDYSSMQILSINNMDMLLFDNYKYSSNNIYVDNADVSIKTVMNILSIKLNTIEYVSNLVLESGDNNE